MPWILGNQPRSKLKLDFGDLVTQLLEFAHNLKSLVLGVQKKLEAPLWARCRSGSEFSFSASPSGTFLLQRTSFQRDVVTTQKEITRI